MTTTVIGNVGTYTIVLHYRTVVDGATFVEKDTTRLGIGRVVGNDTGRSKGRETVGTLRGGQHLRRIFTRYVADSQTTTDTGGILGKIGVLDAAIIVYTDSATITLCNGDTRRLTLIDEAAFNLAATIHIDTTASL